MSNLAAAHKGEREREEKKKKGRHCWHNSGGVAWEKCALAWPFTTTTKVKSRRKNACTAHRLSHSLMWTCKCLGVCIIVYISCKKSCSPHAKYTAITYTLCVCIALHNKYLILSDPHTREHACRNSDAAMSTRVITPHEGWNGNHCSGWCACSLLATAYHSFAEYLSDRKGELVKDAVPDH